MLFSYSAKLCIGKRLPIKEIFIPFTYTTYKPDCLLSFTNTCKSQVMNSYQRQSLFLIGLPHNSTLINSNWLRKITCIHHTNGSWEKEKLKKYQNLISSLRFSYMFCEEAHQLITLPSPRKRGIWREYDSQNCLLLINQTKDRRGSEGEAPFSLLSLVHLSAKDPDGAAEPPAPAVPRSPRSRPPQHGSSFNSRRRRDPPNAKPLPG